MSIPILFSEASLTHFNIFINMTMISIIILVVFTATTCKVHGYSSGAPDFPEVCTSMAPNRRSHGALPQSNTRNVDKFGFAGPVQLDLVFFDR